MDVWVERGRGQNKRRQEIIRPSLKGRERGRYKLNDEYSIDKDCHTEGKHSGRHKWEEAATASVLPSLGMQEEGEDIIFFCLLGKVARHGCQIGKKIIKS